VGKAVGRTGRVAPSARRWGPQRDLKRNHLEIALLLPSFLGVKCDVWFSSRLNVTLSLGAAFMVCGKGPREAARAANHLRCRITIVHSLQFRSSGLTPWQSRAVDSCQTNSCHRRVDICHRCFCWETLASMQRVFWSDVLSPQLLFHVENFFASLRRTNEDIWTQVQFLSLSRQKRTF